MGRQSLGVGAGTLGRLIAAARVLSAGYELSM
jgi:hypothetical protein